MPKASSSGVQVIWREALCEGEMTWQGAMYSRRRLVCHAILAFDEQRPERLWLEQVETEPQYRRHGYATTMLQSAINMFRSEFRELCLVIRPFGNRQGAMSAARLQIFYRKAGFQETEERRKAFSVWSLSLQQHLE